MRVLIAPDAFKGSLSAAEAAGAMAAGIRDAMPGADIVMLPLADGGEGTLDVLARYLAPGTPPAAGIASLPYTDETGEAAVLTESARCIGLDLPEMRGRDVWRRGSGALGVAIREGLDAGIRRFVIALGGSATNDAGLGLLVHLGLSARDAVGRDVDPDLHGLCVLAAIDASGIDARLADCDITVLCDVDVPLCGPGGATFTFGPQKGLSEDALGPVDRAMARFASMAGTSFGHSIHGLPGGGAAGGLGFALAMLGGRLVSGGDFVIGKAGLAGMLDGADWVITGEGRSDAQTLAGKLPVRVARLARAAGVPVALISGDVADAPLLAGRFDAVVPARPAGMPVDSAMDAAASLLREAAAAWAPGVG